MFIETHQSIYINEVNVPLLSKLLEYFRNVNDLVSVKPLHKVHSDIAQIPEKSITLYCHMNVHGILSTSKQITMIPNDESIEICNECKYAFGLC